MSDAHANDEFHHGDRVRTRTGEFADRVGRVVQVRSDTVIVEYEVFGRTVPVEHSPGNIEKIADN